MRGLSIDRTRAVRVAAAAGLALLAISILPGLLRPPPPPELPANVGFSPAETAAPITVPPVAREKKPRKSNVSDRRKAGRREAADSVSRRKSPAGDSRPKRPAGPVRAAPDADPATGSAPSPAPAPEASYDPVPAYTAPAAPPPSPPPPSVPADGSQEFAPR